MLITYDARKRNTYGFVTERLVLKTTDPVNAEKQYPVFVTLEESFSGISEEERKNGPRMILGIEDLKFGEVAKSASLDKEIEFKNTGKRELIIRSLVSNCACIMANAVPERIPAGGAGKIRLTFTPGERTGRQNKSVMVYCNDPERPVQRITISAIVR